MVEEDTTMQRDGISKDSFKLMSNQNATSRAMLKGGKVCLNKKNSRKRITLLLD